MKRSSIFSAKSIDIAYKEFKLSNGLTLLVHEDFKAPIVSVNIWYHAGSKNEGTHKNGLAHLFEHIAFNGSKYFNNDYLQTMKNLGATEINGFTDYDRTSYYQNIPSHLLDKALLLEADRMGNLLDVINKDKLDKQLGVVTPAQWQICKYNVSIPFLTH